MKIVLNNVASPNNVSIVNDNFKKIAIALDEQVLFRDNPPGEPNQMEDELDMNGYRMYNLPVPVLDHEPARFGDVKNIAGNVLAAQEAANRAEAGANRSEVAAVKAEAAALVVEGWEGVVGEFGYKVPVPFVADLNVDIPTFTVEYNGNVYAPVLEEVPFVTTGVFNPSQWRLIQGITTNDLANVSSSNLIGHSISPDGVASTVRDELYNLRKADLKALHPAIQDTTVDLALGREPQDWTLLANGSTEDRYHHGQNMVRDHEGRLHLTYAKGLLHGYGGYLEADNINPHGETIYRYSDDEGATWSPEQVIAVGDPADPGLNPFRTTFGAVIGVTPSGRVVLVVNDVPPPASTWNRFTGYTRYKLYTNDFKGEQLKPDGNPAWESKGAFFQSTVDDYARVYGGRIKIIPKIGGGFRMAFTDYRKTSSSPVLYKLGMWYSDDEFETMPVEGAAITNNAAGATETDFAFVDAKLAFSVSRGNFQTYMTTDGGATPWTLIGNQTNYPAAITGSLIAPVMDVVKIRGKPFLLLSYSERSTNPRMIRWLIASVKDMQKFRTEVQAARQFRPWGAFFQSGAAFTGSAGYSSFVDYGDGQLLYADCTETTISPTTGFMRSDVRITRVDANSWFPIIGGIALKPNTQRLTQYTRNGITTVATFSGSTVAGTPTYTQQTLPNIRIGDFVHTNGNIAVSDIGGAEGQILIGGLAYTHGNTGIHVPVQFHLTSPWNPALRDTHEVVALILNNEKQIRLYKRDRTAGSFTSLVVSDLVGSTFSGYFSCQYLARYEDEP